MSEWQNQYLAGLQASLGALPSAQIEQLVQVLVQACREGRHVWIMGNGGSAATASHMANDLSKGASAGSVHRLRVVALTDNVPLITAWANDVSFADIFAEQLRSLARPSDVMIGFSGSGNSENVLRAVRLAHQIGVFTVGLTGLQGGQLRDLVNLSIHVDNLCMEQVEDLHLIIEHMVAVRLRYELAKISQTDWEILT